MIPNPALLFRSRGQIQNEQLYFLYRRLFFYMAQDFRFNQDCFACHTALATKLAELLVLLAAHIHPTALDPTLPSIELALEGTAGAAEIASSMTFVVPTWGPIAFAHIWFGMGFDEEVIQDMLNGSPIPISPIYSFSLRTPTDLIPDFYGGTTVADIAIASAVNGGMESGQPFSADVAATVLETVI